MTQHHAFRPAGGAGRVLDHREGIRGGVVLDPAVGAGVGDLVRGKPRNPRGPAGHRPELGDRSRSAERDGRAGVAGERFESIERAVARQVGRDRNAARVERAEKRRNEFEAGRIRKCDALARKVHVLKTRGDRACAAVELRVRHRRSLRRVVGRVYECGVIRTLAGESAQAAEQIRAAGAEADLCACPSL